MSCTCATCGPYRGSMTSTRCWRRSCSRRPRRVTQCGPSPAAPGARRCAWHLWPLAVRLLRQWRPAAFQYGVAYAAGRLSGQPRRVDARLARGFVGHRDVALFRYSSSRRRPTRRWFPRTAGWCAPWPPPTTPATAASECALPAARDRLDRWMRAWRAGGCEALVLRTQAAKPSPPAAVRDLAVSLKSETPGCTAPQVAAVIATAEGRGRGPPCRLSGHLCLRDRRGSRRPTR